MIKPFTLVLYIKHICGEINIPVMVTRDIDIGNQVGGYSFQELVGACGVIKLKANRLQNWQSKYKK